MKKSFVLASVALLVGCTVGLIARVAVFVSMNSLNLPAVIGGVVALGLLLTVFSDYAHQPRFRVGRGTKVTRPAARPATSPAMDPASAWTYTTLSA